MCLEVYSPFLAKFGLTWMNQSVVSFSCVTFNKIEVYLPVFKWHLDSLKSDVRA